MVDVGPDFRLPPEDYPAWYGFEHEAPAWPDKAAYGLTELFRVAKFSAHSLGPGDKEQAIDALVAVRDELRSEL